MWSLSAVTWITAQSKQKFCRDRFPGVVRVVGLTCSLATEREQVINSKGSGKIKQLEYQQYLVIKGTNIWYLNLKKSMQCYFTICSSFYKSFLYWKSMATNGKLIPIEIYWLCLNIYQILYNSSTLNWKILRY